MRHDYGYFEEDQLGQIGDIGLWRRIGGYVLLHWKRLAGAILLSLVVIGSSLSLPYMVRLGIDGYIVNETLSETARIQGIAILSTIFIGVVLCGFIANFLQVLVLEWTGQTIMHQMRQQLFDHMLKLDLTFFNRNPAGKLVTRLTNDIQNMHEMFTSVIVTLFNDFLKLAGIMVILFLMNWRMALIISALLPLITLNTVWFSRLARDAFRAIRTHLAQINAFLQESLSGLAVIQIFLREDDTVRDFEQLNNAYLAKNLYQIKIFALFMPAVEFLSAVGTGCIIWFGGGEIIRQHMSIGELAAFLSYMRLFFQPIRELSQKYSIVQSAVASAERIFQLLDTCINRPAQGISLRSEAITGALQFRQVSFSYEDNQPVLHEISFALERGRILAVVGPTGSGKSTIVKLIERFYEPDKGEILIDGYDIKTFDKYTLRRQIGMVMQDVFIVPASIRENILLDGQLAEKKLNRIVEQSQLSRFVKRLPNGLETKIGEGGMDLSSGQKQLLAFARVLARDPRILILDEATSSVDSETELLIDHAVKLTMANRTSIVIAHRLSTVHRADHILVLDKGKIVEQGSHEDLLLENGVYRRLQDLQFIGDHKKNERR